MKRPGSRRAAAIAVSVAWLTGLAACGGSAPAPNHEGDRGQAPGATPGPRTAPRTAIEQRRDAACDQLGPKLTACAVEDAKANLAAGKTEKSQFDRDTAPEVQHKNTEEFEKACKATVYSSRQIRVLEVCFHTESQCNPLLDCLGHLGDADATNHRGAP